MDQTIIIIIVFFILCFSLCGFFIYKIHEHITNKQSTSSTQSVIPIKLIPPAPIYHSIQTQLTSTQQTPTQPTSTQQTPTPQTPTQQAQQNIVYWDDRLRDWKNGINIPNITKPVVYQTSPIIRNDYKFGIYKEFFKEAILFTKQDFSKYKTYLNKLENKDKYIAFNNLPYPTNNGISKCYLVVPPLTIKSNGEYRNYANIYTFYQETTLQEQQELWKNVALYIEEYMKIHHTHNKFYISLHGGSVAYLHVRICREPKFYDAQFERDIAIYWKDRLTDWKNGINIPKIPDYLQGRDVFYETLPIVVNDTRYGIYEEYFNTANLTNKYDITTFDKKISDTEVSAFSNIGGDCMLIVPPKIEIGNNKYKNYAHIALFYKNSTIEEQKKFWEIVAINIEKYINDNNHLKYIYISTHGGGVAWLHLRICKESKYFSSSTKKIIKDKYNI